MLREIRKLQFVLGMTDAELLQFARALNGHARARCLWDFQTEELLALLMDLRRIKATAEELDQVAVAA
jgi:hypothetical protein